MSFWTGILAGQNKDLNSDINKFSDIGGFATDLGEKNASEGSKFFSDIVSGDQGRIGKALGPEIGTIQTQSNQNKKQTAEFGNRSGGNNAAMQTSGDTARASINDLVSKLLGTSASSLLSSGSTLLNQGMDAYGKNAELSNERIKNWSSSVLGMGVTSAISAGESFALGKLPMPKPSSSSSFSSASEGFR